MHDPNMKPDAQGSGFTGGSHCNWRAAAPPGSLLMCAILFATKPTHGTIKNP